jgi:hypothetical protein
VPIIVEPLPIAPSIGIDPASGAESRSVLRAATLRREVVRERGNHRVALCERKENEFRRRHDSLAATL